MMDVGLMGRLARLTNLISGFLIELLGFVLILRVLTKNIH